MVSGKWIDNPWVGGLKACQFSELDLNLDGTRDLFIFDRLGNRIVTFINDGTVGTVDYRHAPQYQSKFPDIQNWALTADYNCDGKMDLFIMGNVIP